MRDLIRMASHAYHYLAVFDEHQSRPLYLGRSRRIATADQRLMLYAKDRGCTAPGCDIPGYWTEVHHTDDWARGGLTDIDRLTLACKPDHKLVDRGWRTVKLRRWQNPVDPAATSRPRPGEDQRLSPSRKVFRPARTIRNRAFTQQNFAKRARTESLL